MFLTAALLTILTIGEIETGVYLVRKYRNSRNRQKGGRTTQIRNKMEPVDIAYKVIKTAEGMEIVKTTAAERRDMKRDLMMISKHYPVIESAPPASKIELWRRPKELETGKNWIELFEEFADSLEDD